MEFLYFILGLILSTKLGAYLAKKRVKDLYGILLIIIYGIIWMFLWELTK